MQLVGNRTTGNRDKPVTYHPYIKNKVVSMRIRAKYRGYCDNCKHTVWQNEQAEYESGKLSHVDCNSALADMTPRIINPKFEHILGKVNKKKLRRLLSTPTA